MSGAGTSQPGLRETAIDVLRMLRDAGYEAYFAGGCVRDRLMGHDPADYDIATAARPEEVAEVFRSSHFVGESFGVMLVRRSGHLLHVATFRTDGVYSDGRHPDSVEFSDAEHDARRRDFTINGLFEDPVAETIIDFVDGQADLDAKLIRAIGKPADRLREDALRTLRAVRFAARFGFEIEAGTAEAVRAAAHDLRGVSRERIGEELKRMLAHPARAAAAATLQSLGLDAAVLAEAHQDAELTRLQRLPDDAPHATALGAWLLDRSGPSNPNLLERARAWSRALLLSNDDQAALRGALTLHGVLAGDDWDALGVAAQKRLAALPDFHQALAIVHADDETRGTELDRRVSELAGTGIAPAPLIDGEDLIGLGLKPGPAFKKILDAVYDAQLEGTVDTREPALDLARSLARNHDRSR